MDKIHGFEIHSWLEFKEMLKNFATSNNAKPNRLQIKVEQVLKKTDDLKDSSGSLASCGQKYVFCWNELVKALSKMRSTPKGMENEAGQKLLAILEKATSLVTYRGTCDSTYLYKVWGKKYERLGKIDKFYVTHKEFEKLSAISEPFMRDNLYWTKYDLLSLDDLQLNSAMDPEARKAFEFKLKRMDCYRAYGEMLQKENTKYG